MKTFNNELQQLYEIDPQAWLEKTVKLLQENNFDAIDWDNLIGEINDLGNERKHKLERYLRQLLIHLLMYQYWQTEKEYYARGWEDEIDNFRYELSILTRSKTLYNYLVSLIPNVYESARKRVIKKTQLSSSIFPETCPYGVEEILDEDWLPNYPN